MWNLEHCADMNDLSVNWNGRRNRALTLKLADNAAVISKVVLVRDTSSMRDKDHSELSVLRVRTPAFE